MGRSTFFKKKKLLLKKITQTLPEIAQKKEEKKICISFSFKNRYKVDKYKFDIHELFLIFFFF